MPLPLPLPRSAPTVRGVARVAAVVLALAAGACGKRGAPLAPLARVPAAVGEWSAARVDDTVVLTLVAPSANVGGDAPADVAQVEIYAATSGSAPTLVQGRVPAEFNLVSTLRVRPPLPPLPALPAGQTPTVPPIPREPGLDQGERATVRDVLPSDPGVAPVAPAAVVPPADTAPRLSLPLVFVPPTAMLKRHYAARAVSRRGEASAWSAVHSLPLAPLPGPPVAPMIGYDAEALTFTWTPRAGAATAVAGASPEWLPSRPLGPAPPATRYNVYDVARDDSAAATRLNEQPLPDATFRIAGVVFDRERCLVVRGVDAIAGVDVEGRASPVACVTPVDTFPPPAPSALEAVGGAGVVSLIWEGVEAADLAGYVVFRGVAGSEPTEPLTAAPIRTESFEDRTVTPGTRYVYVVVAVDSATPANRSQPSNRAEETARR